MGDAVLDRIRRIALALPEVNERMMRGAPTFRFRDGPPICYFHDADFAGDGRTSVWYPARPGSQEERILLDPLVFFAPTPSASGVFGDWVGVYLDDRHGGHVDWEDIEDLIRDAFRTVAPKKLVSKLDGKRADR